MAVLIFPVQRSSAAPSEQPEAQFSVRPSRVGLTVSAGESVTGTLKVYNQSRQELKLTPYLGHLVPPPRQGGHQVQNFAAEEWVTLGDAGSPIPSEQSSELGFSVTVPESAPPGGYHALILLRAGAQGDQRPFPPSQPPKTSVLVLIEVAGEGGTLNSSAKVSAVLLEVKWEGLKPFLRAKTTVTNAGNTNIVTGGLHTYRVWGLGAKEPFHRAQIGPRALLRSERHTFRSSWAAAPIVGHATVTSETLYSKGEGQFPDSVHQASVLIVPWQVVIPAIIVLALGGVSALVVARRRRRRRLTPVAQEAFSA